ncbi:CDC25B [Acanthosepion pharaonis]|uniref:M-phase inducer phosphatase n=1 Tax=Acanthosepion pharaonis TaxID=158019 RepID=A0A812C1H2_ACAPH|nr:CDC25B [Sepia pharaonis]
MDLSSTFVCPSPVSLFSLPGLLKDSAYIDFDSRLGNERKNFVPMLPNHCKLAIDNIASPLCINQSCLPNDAAEETSNDYMCLQSEQEDGNSQDSGLGLEKDKEIEFLQSDHSPNKPTQGTFTGEPADDGFSDHLESMDMPESSADMSDGIKSLMEAPLSCAPVERTDIMCDNVRSSMDDTPTAMRKGMNRSQSFDIRRRSSSKRDRISDENTPILSKRRKPFFNKAPSQIDVAPIVRYQRSHSETEAQIKSAVHKIIQNPHLIGDGSKPYCLPTIPGKHKDLKSITPDTMRRVLRGEYNNIIDSCKIIDCRYPYEFKGGHIISGQNDYTKENIMKNFLENPPVLEDTNKRVVLVFHCEFSSERAPKLARFLRNMDRSANKDCYPSLYYPEIYILDGGYKAFFESGTEMCEPPNYKPMLHPDHSSDLKHFRAKSKSWAGERAPRTGLRQLNF